MFLEANKMKRDWTDIRNKRYNIVTVIQNQDFNCSPMILRHGVVLYFEIWLGF